VDALKTALAGSPAHLATLEELARITFDGTANVHATADGGATPLIQACRAGDLAGVTLLVAAGAAPTHAALIVAAAKGDLPTLQYLAERTGVGGWGGDLHPYNLEPLSGTNKRTSALHAAAAGGKRAVAAELVRRGAPVNTRRWDGATPLYLAAQGGFAGLLADLIAAGGDHGIQNENGASPLAVACQQRHAQVVRALLGVGADANRPMANGVTPIWSACDNGDHEVVRLLLAVGTLDVNVPGIKQYPPLYMACDGLHYDVIELMLADGRVDVNLPRRWTPLHEAAVSNAPDVVQLLVAHPATDLTIHDRNGSTALHIAFEEEHEDVAAAIIAGGGDRVDLSVVDSQADTYLYLACEHGFVGSAATILARSTAQINQTCWRDQTPLKIAVQWGHHEVVRLLLGTGLADVNGRVGTNLTPFATAFLGGMQDIAQDLLAAGADPRLPCTAKPEEDEVTLPCQEAAHRSTVAWWAGAHEWSALRHAATTGQGGVITRRLKLGTLAPDALPAAEQISAVRGAPDPITAAIVRRATLGWTPRTHMLHHPGFRDMVRTVVGVAERRYRRNVVNLPGEIWYYVLSFALRANHPPTLPVLRN